MGRDYRGAVGRLLFAGGTHAGGLDPGPPSVPLAQPRPAGVVAQPSNDATPSAAIKVVLPGYALFNALACYQVDAKTDVALNVSKLFDRTHYRRHGFHGGAIFGDPRRIALSLNSRF
ncbi:TonB-dependent receptor [Azoarcus indigens]|uniref:TonB-dependent receptor n=1 Tax=Azoarcus indigens TaxID=29545 RepID=UPI00106029AF|nr:TonB-dependent receptor [Azoarcus indigens]NMG67715.1 TonB-dependent receptor [Azoarcus indigens]